MVKDVDVPQRAHKQQTSRIRALIGVMVLGLAATVLVAFLLESIAQHRAVKERRGSSAGSSSGWPRSAMYAARRSPGDQPTPTGDLPGWADDAIGTAATFQSEDEGPADDHGAGAERPADPVRLPEMRSER